MKQKLRGCACLLLATLIWGSAFTAQSVGMDHIGPFTFQTVRCFLACLFLFPLSRLRDRSPDFWKRWADPGLWKAGTLTGIALFFAAGLQQMGLQYTGAGKAGFLTAMYIVMVPVLGLFLGKKPPMTAWIGVGIAVTGLYLLSGTDLNGIRPGDWMLLGCAFFFAVQIQLIDLLGPAFDGIRLNCVQSLVCACLSGLVMLLTEEVNPENILRCWLPLAYAGVLSMGLAYTLQILGQQLLPPTPASLLMSLESVFALLFGWLLLEERLSSPELAGCCLVFLAVLISQLPQRKHTP